MSVDMKTLTIDGVTYVIVDETARSNATKALTDAKQYADDITAKALSDAMAHTVKYVDNAVPDNINDFVGIVSVAKGGTGNTTFKDSLYTTVRYRGSALYEEEKMVDPTVNGVINWAYA